MKLEKMRSKISAIITIFILCFNLFSCMPAETNTSKNLASQSFSCISSQDRCEVSTEFGRFNVQFSGEIEQGKIKTEVPFTIQLKFNALDSRHKLQSVNGYMEGTTMFMGKIPVFFQAGIDTNTLVADTMFGSCSQEIMTWRLWLTIDIVIDEAIKQQSIFIDFDSKRV